MGTISRGTTKSGETRYYGRIRRKGHKALTGAFARLTDARAWIRQVESDMERGRYLPDNRMTFAEAIAKYLADIAPDAISTSSMATRRLHLKWWEQRLGHLFIGDIKPQHIAEGRDALRAMGREPATIGTYLASASTVFTMLVREHGLAANPCFSVKRPALPVGRVRFLDDTERAALLAACKASPHPDLYDIVIMAICTGMRKREICFLTWRDIDINAGTLTLQAGRTKTKRARQIPITGPVIEMLRNRPRDSIRVFRGAVRPLDRAFVAAREAAGIRGFVFHDLRHSAASYLAASGASLHEISIILGHSSVVMSQRYSHLTESHVRGVIERMNQKIIGK